MSNSFKKFKDVFIRNSAIFAAIIGVSAGLFVCGVLWLTLKLCAVNLAFWLYLIIGVAVASAATVALFFIIKPTDKKIAKRLDDELKLNERVQTMVEYDGKDGAVLDLQREDAERRLSQSKIVKPSLKKVVKLAAIPTLSAVVFLTAAFVPAKQLPPDTSDNYHMDNWQIISLTRLIEEVRDESSLRDGLKDAHVTVLESLLGALRETSSQTAMKASVRSAIVMISTATDGASSYKVFAEKFAECQTESFAAFGDGLIKGAKVYSSNNKITDFSEVESIEPKLYERSLSVITQSCAAFKTEVNGYNALGFANGVQALSQAFNQIITSVEYEDDEPLKVAVKVMSDGVDGVVYKYANGGYTLSYLKSELEGVCASYAEAAAVEIAEQAYALMLTEYEINKLCGIFNIKISNPDGPTTGGDSPGEGGEDTPGSGGWGEGGSIYGSNDLIFFPDDGGKYVEYGEVFTEYYWPKIDEYLRSDSLTEEAKQFINNYFNILK